MTFSPQLSLAIRSLREWFATHRRLLPFRNKPTPYRVWVSEVMSQQTTASAIIPYFQRFIEKFPTLAALSQASEEEVLHLWSGLGYYSRGRNLLKSAQIIASQHKGKIPSTYSELIALPGIGPYTAGAILCFGFQKSSAIVDTNIKRVLCRVRAKDLSNKRLSHLSYIFASYFDAKVPQSPRDTMQALMELGSIHCKINSPECSLCPLKELCLCVRTNQDPRKFPAPKKLPSTVLLQEEAFLYIAEQAGSFSICVTLPSEQRWIRGLWDLPLQPLFNAKTVQTKLSISYQITHHKIQREVYVIPVPGTSLKKNFNIPYQWVQWDPQNASHLENLPAGAALKKSLQLYAKWRKISPQPSLFTQKTIL